MKGKAAPKSKRLKLQKNAKERQRKDGVKNCFAQVSEQCRI
jgi:hypothetical protein